MEFSKLDHFYLLLLFVSFPQLSFLQSVVSVPEEVIERTEEIAEPAEEGALCHSPLDIITALDASGSVRRENWERSVDFAEKLAERLLALNAESRMGVIDFSQVANEAIQPSSDLAVVNQGLQKLKNWYQNGITRTELALKKALGVFQRINRDTAKKLLVVVTDGQTTPLNNMEGLALLTVPTKDLKAAGVHVIAVGVGTMVNDEELNFMATEPDNENVFHIDNYDKLLDMVNAISKAVCPVPPTVTPTEVPTSETPSEPACPAVYTKLGCMKDDMRSPRPLPELLFTDRDPSMKQYSNISISWSNWNSYMKDLVCRCAKEAKVRNYAFFSIQFYGECWSGPEAGDTYNRAGAVDTCVTRDYKKCDPSDPTECVGEKETNFVYGVDLPVHEPACKVKYHKLGCYKDDRKNPRPLPKLLLTDRDPKSPVFSSIKIDWGKWDSYMSDLVCRCAEKAAENNYRFFGLQYYGECWSGPDDDIKYDKLGRADQKCVTSGYQKCPANPEATDKVCVGQQWANYVYGIERSGDAGCSVPFKLVGCYKDSQKKSGRPLPELLFTDRDPKSKVYSGIPVNWGEWDNYMADLVCRCSEAAKAKKYSHFGIQFYGECWSGPEVAGTFAQDGLSNKCVGKEYDDCDPNVHRTCAGKNRANAVYSI